MAQQQGFMVLDQNYLKRWGEIDIVAQQRQIMHFVEVKTVSREILQTVADMVSREMHRPEDNISRRKLQRLQRAISSYAEEKALPADLEWQIDVITVTLDRRNHRARVKWMPNVIL